MSAKFFFRARGTAGGFLKKNELLNDILKETEELIKIFVTSIKTAEKKER